VQLAQQKKVQLVQQAQKLFVQLLELVVFHLLVRMLPARMLLPLALMQQVLKMQHLACKF
jgi:hypothetical protein